MLPANNFFLDLLGQWTSRHTKNPKIWTKAEAKNNVYAISHFEIYSCTPRLLRTLSLDPPQ